MPEPAKRNSKAPKFARAKDFSPGLVDRYTSEQTPTPEGAGRYQYGFTLIGFRAGAVILYA